MDNGKKTACTMVLKQFLQTEDLGQILEDLDNIFGDD
jgi:hypothetical protein